MQRALLYWWGRRVTLYARSPQSHAQSWRALHDAWGNEGMVEATEEGRGPFASSSTHECQIGWKAYREPLRCILFNPRGTAGMHCEHLLQQGLLTWTVDERWME